MLCFVTSHHAHLHHRIYGMDPPTNNFPSLHCANAIFLTLLLHRLSPATVFLMGPYSLAVCGSTLLLKQHWLADVAIGMIFGALSFRLLMEPQMPIRSKARLYIYSHRRLLIVPVIYASALWLLYTVYGFMEP